jgi:hypothetical protein
MKIARIVSSNSHIDYIARVIDSLDVNEPPPSDAFGFGQFVSIPLDPGTVVGIIYDSKLVNPEYGSFGPRLSPKPALGSFSPDYLNEQGVLLGVLLLGLINEMASIVHGVPRGVVPAGQDVFGIEPEAVRKFHTDQNDCIQIHYYSQVIGHAGPFAVPLLESIIDQLSLNCSETDAQRLGVLRQSLAWQRAFGGIRL